MPIARVRLSQPTPGGGGLVGNNAGLINDSYTRNNVSDGGQGINIGGLAGINIGRIVNSISDSDVEGAAFAGGLVGINAR